MACVCLQSVQNGVRRQIICLSSVLRAGLERNSVVILFCFALFCRRVKGD